MDAFPVFLILLTFFVLLLLARIVWVLVQHGGFLRRHRLALVRQALWINGPVGARRMLRHIKHQVNHERLHMPSGATLGMNDFAITISAMDFAQIIKRIGIAEVEQDIAKSYSRHVSDQGFTPSDVATKVTMDADETYLPGMLLIQSRRRGPLAAAMSSEDIAYMLAQDGIKTLDLDSPSQAFRGFGLTEADTADVPTKLDTATSLAESRGQADPLVLSFEGQEWTITPTFRQQPSYQLSGSGVPHRVVQNEVITVGRAQDADVRIQHDRMSRIQFRLRWDGTSWYIVPSQDTTNPTAVNGHHLLATLPLPAALSNIQVGANITLKVSNPT